MNKMYFPVFFGLPKYRFMVLDSSVNPKKKFHLYFFANIGYVDAVDLFSLFN